MQSLGLSDSVPRSDNRLKGLLWPAIRNETDFDYVTEQGFWVCCVVAAVIFFTSLFIHRPLGGTFEAIFYLLAGTGVRQSSRGAAVTAFFAYLLRVLVGVRLSPASLGVVTFIFLALLLSTVRATFLAVRWQKSAPAPQPILTATPTLLERISDQIPARLWPVGRWVFGFFAAIEIFLLLVALTVPTTLMVGSHSQRTISPNKRSSSCSGSSHKPECTADG